MAERVAEDLQRVVAPNPSPFTAEGTNTWLLGREGVAVIDPGPDDPRHLAALLAALEGRRVGAILVTHAHRDHSGLAPALAAATGAPVLGFGGLDGAGGSELGGGEGLDRGFRPERRLAEGERIAGEGWALRALHTPGHLADHLSFDDGARLWTGDHAMGWATSLVSPPEGDMGHYVESLRRLIALGGRVLLPGHGPVVEEGAARLRALLAHRLAREAQVLDGLAQGPATAEGLASRLYAGLPPGLQAAGARNVLAHLIDLARRGLAEPLGPLSASVAFRRV